MPINLLLALAADVGVHTRVWPALTHCQCVSSSSAMKRRKDDGRRAALFEECLRRPTGHLNPAPTGWNKALQPGLLCSTAAGVLAAGCTELKSSEQGKRWAATSCERVCLQRRGDSHFTSLLMRLSQSAKERHRRWLRSRLKRLAALHTQCTFHILWSKLSLHKWKGVDLCVQRDKQ